MERRPVNKFLVDWLPALLLLFAFYWVVTFSQGKSKFTSVPQQTVVSSVDQQSATSVPQFKLKSAAICYGSAILVDADCYALVGDHCIPDQIPVTLRLERYNRYYASGLDIPIAS